MPRVKEIKSHPKLTPNKRRELEEKTETIDREDKDQLVQWARSAFARIDQRQLLIRQLVEMRLRNGLSAAEVAERADMHPSNVSRFENPGDNPNPTLDTIQRYARAVGAQVRFAVLDQAQESAGTKTEDHASAA